MSSINHYPTFLYSQPEDYHFSHDSVFLAREIYERHQIDLLKPDVQILDLCAGCGVVGLDLLFHQLKEKNQFNGEIDFLEIQKIYFSHFATNLKTFKNLFPAMAVKANWIQDSYANPNLTKKYDLIVSNPPYFLSGQGRLSPSEFKNRCRFFLDSDWQTLIKFINSSLNKNGKAYFLIRDDLKKVIEKENNEITFPFQVRGTWVAQLFQ